MRLVMTLLVRDEADIVRDNVAFHLAHGVDFVIVTDNGSTDGTRDILDELARQHPVRIIDEPGDDYAQHRWVSRMAELARAEYGADWVLNNDADEFWLPSLGRLTTGLDDVTANIVMCQRRHMVFPCDRAPRGGWLRGIIHRVARPHPTPVLQDWFTDPLPEPYFYFDLPPKALCRARGLKEVHQGNHDASYDVQTRTGSPNISIYHYPVRGFAQFRRKVEQGGAAYARNTSVPALAGWHWRRWHRMIAAGQAERAFREALPSDARLQADVSAGIAVVDRAMLDDFGRRGG
jgi:glycosyltransferase involved in cell wall biosynthesis